MALDVTTRTVAGGGGGGGGGGGNGGAVPDSSLQSLINGPINAGSIEHLLSNYSLQQVQQHHHQLLLQQHLTNNNNHHHHHHLQSTKSVEDATLFLKAAAAAAAAAAAVSASENACSPCPTTTASSSLPESPKSQSPSFIVQQILSANDLDDPSNTNMGRPGSISPPQPLALTGNKSRDAVNQLQQQQQQQQQQIDILKHFRQLKSHTNFGDGVTVGSPLEKLQSLSPNTITLSTGNHHHNHHHHYRRNSTNSNHNHHHRHHHDLDQQGRALKFSIDNILSPEFGKNDAGRSLFYSYYQQFQEKYSCFNLVKSSSNSSGNNTTNNNNHISINGKNHHQNPNGSTPSNQSSHHNRNKLSFDIQTIVSKATPTTTNNNNNTPTTTKTPKSNNNNNKRKRSDSESSSVSSMSNNSKDATSFVSSSSTLVVNNNSNSNHSISNTATDLTKELSIDSNSKDSTLEDKAKQPVLWPAWVYCTRYSDRPSSGPRSRKIKKKEKKADEKRPRTAFTAEQLARLKQEFNENKYLTEKRRQDLARELKLNESQIKIWFQNKRAKIKKSSPSRGPLALHLMAQGLYNHSTMPIDSDEEFDENSYKQTSSPGLSESSSKTS